MLRRTPRWLKITSLVFTCLFVVGMLGTLVAYVASDKVKDKIDNAIDALQGKSTSEITTADVNTSSNVIETSNVIVTLE